MNCYICNSEVIWGGDHDLEDDQDHEIVSNISCPTCCSFYLVYHQLKDSEEDK